MGLSELASSKRLVSGGMGLPKLGSGPSPRGLGLPELSSELRGKGLQEDSATAVPPSRPEPKLRCVMCCCVCVVWVLLCGACVLPACPAKCLSLSLSLSLSVSVSGLDLSCIVLPVLSCPPSQLRVSGLVLCCQYPRSHRVSDEEITAVWTPRG